MKKLYLVVFLLLSLTLSVLSQSSSPDVSSMQALQVSLGNSTSLQWLGRDPCKWNKVRCDMNNRVTRIQIGSLNLTGSLPPDLKNLTSLTILEVMKNQLTGPIPSLAGLSSLVEVRFNENNFSSIPSDFFTGLTSLQIISLDYNNFSAWKMPETLKDATALQSFSATAANIYGTIPDFFGEDNFPGLTFLNLAGNNLHGQIPSSFGRSSIQTLWLNDQKSDFKLNGSVAVLENMTSLTQVWLQNNLFTGPLPDLSRLTSLEDLDLRNNQLTGIVPSSLVGLPKLTTISLTNNFLQGLTPKFDTSKVTVDMKNGSNSFCLDEPGVACNSRVNILLSIAESVGYPLVFAENWKGDDPCNTSSQVWRGVQCDDEGDISTILFQNFGLAGTISSNFSMLTVLSTLILSNNTLTGTIPNELTLLSNLEKLDVSNNHLRGTVPKFGQNVTVIIDGNPDIVKDNSTAPPPATPPAVSPDTNGRVSSPSSPDTDGRGSKSSSAGNKNSNTVKILGSAIGAVCAVIIVGLGVCLYARKRKPSSRLQSVNAVAIAHQNAGADEIEAFSHTRTWPSDINSDLHSVESGNMVISIQFLRNVTNDFSRENILGKGGFGTVYKGELHDGSKIAVKRMESGLVGEKGLAEFMSEISVLTKVRHRHLVALLGYCLDGKERLLVYEYMPQGALSSHLFRWKEEGLKPLEWTRRLSIALDVARAVEYLHGLAHQSFIHRDLKPSNVLLGDDMRAKVADFGLVRLAPENGHSVETRVAGTFGYLAPEYVATGRVTTKVDIFSFGVILMELITGRKAIDNSQSEGVHLITWFSRMHVDKNTFRKAIDETIELGDYEETLDSVCTVAELAGHCCAMEASRRPDMSHVVNVLSSLAELWTPAEPDSGNTYGIDLDITLPPELHCLYNLNRGQEGERCNERKDK